MSCKVGNQTNSQDPQAVNSRVFVGNLNTFQCSKTDVERIFQRYGRIAGISMHKGYAFIQFTNPFDARSACLGEDGRLLWGQTLDVNMVAEPKAHQTGRKRQNIAKTGNDWDYYYDSFVNGGGDSPKSMHILDHQSQDSSYYAQVGFPGPRLVPPMKRARLHVPPNPQNKSLANKVPSPNKSHPTCNNSYGDLKSYSTPDILICGNCRELFSEVEQLLEHKKTYCKLRFTCKCHTLNGKTSGDEPAALLCSQCKDSFHSAWDLMVHVQAAHMLNIYQLSVDPSTTRDQSEGKEGENGGCNGSVDRGSPNGFNPNGSLLMGDSLMEDSHCQTDLDLSPNHRSESSSTNSLDISGSSLLGSGGVGSSSSTVTTSTTSTSTSTSTNDCGHPYAENPMTLTLTDMISLRNCQNRLITNGEISSGVNQILVNGNGSSFASSPSSSNRSSTCSIIGQVTNNNNSSSSPSPYSQPMEASTQTSQSDNLLPIAANGPSVNSSGGGNSTSFDEHCGMVSAIKSEGSVSVLSLPLTNGQVAGV